MLLGEVVIVYFGQTFLILSMIAKRTTRLDDTQTLVDATNFGL